MQPGAPPRRPSADVLLLALATVFWGAAFPLTRYTVRELSPLAAAFLRYALAGLFFVAALLRSGELFRGVDRRAMGLWALLGLTGLFGYNALFFTGIKLASASEGAVIIPLVSPVAVALMAAVFLRERLGTRLVAGGSLAAVGTAVNVLAARGAGGSAFHVAGDLLFVGASLCWGAYSVIGKIALRRGSPLQVTGWSNLIGTALLAPFAWAGLAGGGVLRIGWDVWTAIGLSAFLSTFLAVTWWNRGVRALGAARAGMFFYIVPATALVISSAWLGERLAPAQWLGTAIVLAGVAVASSTRRPGSAPASSGERSLGPPRAPRRTSRPLTVVALLLGLFLAAMEMTVVSTAMPTAVGDLGGIHLYSWAFASYMLASTVTVPIHGKLADLHGRKPVMLAGIVLFLAGSFLCGHASGMGQLIAFRALQGLGAGAIQPIAMTIVGDLFDFHERARWQGIFGSVWGLAGIAGPLLGGAIVKWLSWRWVFYVNIPLGLACAVVLLVAYHERVERHDHRLDVLGAALLAAAVVSLLLAARSREIALVAVPAGAAAVALFVLAERRAPEPLLPLGLFRGRVIAVSSAVGALVGAAMISMVTYVPLYVQSVLGASPTAAGSAITPMVVGWPIASAIGGRLLPRLGYRILIRGGLLLSALSAAAMALLLGPDSSIWVPRVLTALFGAGLGFANTPLVIAVQTSVPWNRRGVATASSMFFRTIGGTLAVGILGGVLASALGASGAPPGAADRLLGPERQLLDPALLAGLAAILRLAMARMFWVIAAIAAAAFAASIAFPPLAVAARPQPLAGANPPDEIAAEPAVSRDR